MFNSRQKRKGFMFLMMCTCIISLLAAGEKELPVHKQFSDDPAKPGIRISAFVQSIAYKGIQDEYAEYSDHFSIRRARLDSKFRLGKSVSGRIQGDLTCTPVLLDAYVDLKFGESVAFRMGRCKSPLSLERAQSVPSLLFNDFAYTAGIAPNRDIGIAYRGRYIHGVLDLQLAYMNGAGFGASSSGDPDDAKDWVVHLGFAPPVSAAGEGESSLLIAAGASGGTRNGDALHCLKTPAGTDVFRYPASVTARGKMYRCSPQFRWVSPRVFVLGEYILADYGIADTSGQGLRVRDRAWTLSAGYVISGAERSVNGVTLSENANISAGGKGAFELAARIHGFHADPELFDVFVSPSRCAERVFSLETGLNWYYADKSCIRLLYTRSIFEKGAISGDRRPENTVLLSIDLTGGT